MKTIILTLVIAAAVVIAAFVGFVYSGFFYIGADAPDYPVISWAARHTRLRSVARHSASIKPPGNLDRPALIREGAKHYKEMCVGCHLAPGKSSSEMREGLHPRPPKLAQVAATLKPRTIFWTIKHGVRMTAMPAWGKSHSDQKIWAMTAFIKNQLPQMSAAEFKAVPKEEDEDDSQGHHHHE